MVTAGPTYEKIDPVRFIGNFSTGKMGFAIAEKLAENGAKVILVSGPTYLEIKHPNIDKINVTSAQEMYESCIKNYANCDVTIMAAAVADFTVTKQHLTKIKSEEKTKNLDLKLSPTIDIAQKLGQLKTKNQILVGFALETDNEEKNAMRKIESKNLDFIILNSLKDKGAGFGVDTNKITIIHKGNKSKVFELKTKHEVAADIVNELIEVIQKNKNQKQ